MTDQTNRLELLHGPDIQKILDREDVDVYGYVLNMPALYFIVGLALVFYGLGAYCWWQTHLTHTVWKALFGTAMLLGGALSVLALYWHHFATTRFLAIAEDRLFVGGKERLWSIDWDLLDADKMGFQQMELSRLRGILNIRVGGQDVRLHLFNAFAVLADIQGFMYAVLSKLESNSP